jgi:hypothetical protein
MTRLDPDYDGDPGRWRSMDRRWLVAGDVHEIVAERIAHRRLRSVLDLGCGQGRPAACGAGQPRPLAR